MNTIPACARVPACSLSLGQSLGQRSAAVRALGGWELTGRGRLRGVAMRALEEESRNGAGRRTPSAVGPSAAWELLS
jgi:hypothetical protein